MIRTVVQLMIAVLICLIPQHSGVGETCELRVRIVNPKNGRVFKEDRVFLFSADTRYPDFLGRQETDRNGVARFPCPEGVKKIYVRAPGHPCAVDEYPLDEILSKGTIGRNYCSGGPSKYPIEAKPGDLVLFSRPIRWWEGQW